MNVKFQDSNVKEMKLILIPVGPILSWAIKENRSGLPEMRTPNVGTSWNRIGRTPQKSIEKFLRQEERRMEIPPLILNWQRREVMMSRLRKSGKPG